MIAADSLLTGYRGKRVLLDANLLLLYLLGSFQREQIPLFKRTSSFRLEEFDLLVAVMRHSSALVTTPHILTEVSNLANALPAHLKGAWFRFFATTVRKYVEVYTPAGELFEESCFNPFGLADASIQNASRGTLLLTDDFRLSGYLASIGVTTINFRDLADTLLF